MKSVLKHPWITEKSSALQGNQNQYVFVVDPEANKFEIKKEVEALKKGIKVESVKTIRMGGKVKRMGRSQGKRSNWKKAIVRLQTGHTLEFVEKT